MAKKSSLSRIGSSAKDAFDIPVDIVLPSSKQRPVPALLALVNHRGVISFHHRTPRGMIPSYLNVKERQIRRDNTTDSAFDSHFQLKDGDII